MPSKKTAPPAPPEPDRLVRQKNGGYVTEDGRFSVEQSNDAWFVADQQTADDFGLPRVVGPFATLKAVRDAIPEARSAPTSIRRPIARSSPRRQRKAALPPKPETWLDRLSTGDRRRAEGLVKALEGLGLPDAEEVAKARIGGKVDRQLAARLLRARIDQVLDEAEADEAGRELVAAVLEVLAAGGSGAADVPGWAVVETDAEGTLTDRAISLD